MNIIYKDSAGVEWMRCPGEMHRVIWHERGFVVVKVPGHTVWGGIAMGRDYVRAQYVMYEDVRSRSEPKAQWAKRISFPVRS